MHTYTFIYSVYLSLLLFLFVNLDHVSSYMVDGNPYRHRETLDPGGKYQLEWFADRPQNKIIFNVTVETRGYVGFGLSDNGKMTGADIVIGGVNSESGQAYFWDMHAVGTQIPEEDPSQDWKLEEAMENGTHTFLRFSRNFDTCDPQDYQITEDKVTLIWAYGERDNILYHHGARGIFKVYLLNPEYAPQIRMDPLTNRPAAQNFVAGNDFKVWTINRKVTIPSDDTTYWCTIHKAPLLPRKHHAVGIQIHFPDDQSRRFVHHLFTYKCNAPKTGANRDDTNMFSNFVGHRGQQQCHSLRQPIGPMPTEYCTELFMGWAVGGTAFFNPPHVGFPFGSNPDEYYMVQIHYDNVNKVAGQVVNVNLNIFYTDDLRPEEGGTLNLRHTTPGRTPSFLIPPSSIDQKIYGICGAQCTSNILPKEGINIYALIFHSHNSGRKMKLHHFRQGKELPWIASDQNYGFGYQQRRILPEERKVLPGDELVVECEYDNTWTNGTVVGGYTSRQEMCVAFLFYYSKILEFQQCSSEIASQEGRQKLLNGVTNITWSDRELEFLVADDKSPWKGMKISEVSDKHVNWNWKRRQELEIFQREHRQVNWCYRELFAGGSMDNSVPVVDEEDMDRLERGPMIFTGYPRNAVEYVPPKRSCPDQK